MIFTIPQVDKPLERSMMGIIHLILFLIEVQR
jgi:hypothetical protein